MPVAEIIAIGTELLLGEIQDTNTKYLARELRDAGIDLYRSTIIGDNAERIARSIQESLARADIVITTGGLGPTVDDPTRQAVALAMETEIEFCPELWEQITERFGRYGRFATENNRRQAYIPRGATAIENLVGTAPAFRFEQGQGVVISLPGVPREMEYLIQHEVLPYLKQKYKLHGTIKARVLHVAGPGESQIDEWIGDLETHANPTVGLLAHPGQVDIRITAKAGSVEEADRMITELQQEIQARLGENIYGADNATLETVLANKLAERGWRMAAFECGLGGTLTQRLSRKEAEFAGAEAQTELCEKPLQERLESLRERFDAQVGLGALLEPAGARQVLHLSLLTPDGAQESERSYGGAPQNAVEWATNMALDFARRNL